MKILPPNNDQGFTFIEVVVSVVITVPLLILLIQIIPSMHSTALKSKNITLSQHLAMSKMEKIYHTLRFVNFSTSVSESAAALPSPYDAYAQVVIETASTSVKTIAVTVWYDEDKDLTQDSDELSFTCTRTLVDYQ